MRKCKLGDLFQIKQGFAFKSANYVDNSQYAIVTLANISESNNFQYNLANMRYYEGEFPDSVILKSGDLILPMTEQVEGLFGNSAFVPKENNVTFVLNQRVGLVKPFLYSDRFYIHYLLALDSVRQQLEYRATGTRQRNISPDGIYDVNVEIHEPKERERIGEFLYRLEQKVNNNNNIIQLLESKGKEFYDYWFVQFDFPDANGRPYKTSGGKMEWNETISREIPVGWGITTLEKYFEIGNGKDHSQLEDGIYPVYGSGGLMRRVNKFLCNEESVLIPRKGTLNNVMHVRGAFWTVDTMYYTKMKRVNIANYVYQTVNLFNFEKLNTGSALPSMTASIIYSLKVPNAPTFLIDKYEKYASEFFTKIQLLEEENRKLGSLRDFLLPMLMNGQVTFRQ